MRNRKGLQFASAPADLSVLLTGRVMVSCFIQIHLASCTESGKGGAYSTSRSRRSLFELLVRSFLVEIARPFRGVQACWAVHVRDSEDRSR
jgi:hypothetical protein